MPKPAGTRLPGGRRSPQLAGSSQVISWPGLHSPSSLPSCSGRWSGRLLCLDPSMASASHALGGIVLIAAGAYQWSPLKDVCLAQCQSPLFFLMRHGGFRRDAPGCLVLGLRHGTYCVGCCWALMRAVVRSRRDERALDRSPGIARPCREVDFNWAPDRSRRWHRPHGVRCVAIDAIVARDLAAVGSCEAQKSLCSATSGRYSIGRSSAPAAARARWCCSCSRAAPMGQPPHSNASRR